MDYQTRMRLITDHLNTFLRRFKRPEHLGVDQSLVELRSMAAAVNARVASDCSSEDLAQRMDTVFQSLVETYRGRDWPKVADFVAAMKATIRPGGAPAQQDSGASMLEWARKLWFHGSESCPPKTVIPPANTWEIAKVLISEGADPWEIRRSNFQTDTAYYHDLPDNALMSPKSMQAVAERISPKRME